MIKKNKVKCPICSGYLKRYDNVQRVVRAERHRTRKVKVRRLRCTNCGHTLRVTPDYMLPFKQYHKDIIHGVIEGRISSDIFGYEDYPCEITMKRWINEIDISSR